EQASPVAQAAETLAPPAGGVETSTGQIFGQSPAISATPPSLPIGPGAAPAEQSGATASSDSRRRARELEPLSTDRFGVHFTADAELRDLIERARALASHRLPNGDLASLMKLMAASFVRQEEKPSPFDLAGRHPKGRVAAYSPRARRKLARVPAPPSEM
ncbi:MAG TPA: hypothetical protein VER96_41560, partial [Polyangiaceae bacterium]|nr:hypothetical protein [Polyangiaceae bacterium]